MLETDDTLNSLLQSVTDLETSLHDVTDDERVVDAAARLRESVARPLRIAIPPPPAEQDTSALDSAAGNASARESRRAQDWREHLWELARAATELRCRLETPELQEATAALQDLAIVFTDAAQVESRRAELEDMQAGLESRIQIETNGPYLVTNASNLYNGLGEPLRRLPQMALCRCGESQRKPLCDGSHARIGFSDAKDPHRVPDRRDTYVGQQVTILDNRGTCQHSGYCTDRLASVFHVDTDPFVTPSGGRMDEIIRAVRDCPSGALGYAIDGVEARDDVDYHTTREPAIEVSKDGPYRITGGIPLTDNDGNDVDRNEGASREHYALVSLWTFPEQAVLQRHALVRRVPRPGRRGGSRADAVRMGRRPARAHPDDAQVLREIRTRRPAPGAAVRRHVGRPPPTCREWLAEVFCGPTATATSTADTRA